MIVWSLADLVLMTVVGVCAVYLATLTLSAVGRRRRGVVKSGERLDIAVVVPAHDEEAGIADTIVDLALQHYPLLRSRVIVVADNCGDGTARVAAEHGAEVWTRRDRRRCGKGFALDFAFGRILDEGWADVVAVVDADTRVDPWFLSAVERAMRGGAEVVQGRYRVLNAGSSWRTRMMALALGFAHHVRPLGRSRRGFGVGLKGNGMAFTAGVLRRIPWDAHSKVEDLEYACRLAEHGVYATYEPEAEVAAAMPAGGSAAAVQRRRWEEGRREAALRFAPRLVAAGIRGLDPRPLEMALHIVLPPLAMLAGLAFAGLAADLALGRWTAAAGWTLLATTLAACVAASPKLSGEGRLSDLARVPAYILWKAAVFARGLFLRSGAWERTPREKAAQLAATVGERR